MSPTITTKRLLHADGLPIPARMTAGSSGCDVCAAVGADENIVIEPGKRELIPTGFCFDIPCGYEIQVRPRSGLAAKFGVTVLNTPGTIDADYRGEVKIILINHGEEPFVVKRGDRVAQLVIARVANDVMFVESDTNDISETQRGAGGFGHTGS